MKTKFGAIIVDGRGKIGGHVASKNRGGAYLRTKVTPTNPKSVAQSAVRNRLTSLSQAWKSLTETQRSAWNAAVANFAKTDIFGDIKQPTGLNLYVKLNANLGQIGVNALTTPPLPSSVVAVTGVSGAAGVGAGTFVLSFAPTPIPANTSYIVRATKQLSPGISNISNELRDIVILPPTTATGESIMTSYTNKFGSLTAGQKIGLSLTAVNELTGQKGQEIISTLIVGA